MLFNDQPQRLARWEKLLQDPVFTPKFNTSLAEQREIAYA
jgi:acyl-CoA oxidase